MRKYLVTVLRHSHQQSDPVYIQQFTQIIILSTMNTVGICKHITILILYQVNSCHASIQHFFFFLCFQLIVLPPTNPSSIPEMCATVYTPQITSMKSQNLHYGLLLKQACHFLSQLTFST
jgi:hypothetical protein